MARITSACPRERSAFAQTALTGLGKRLGLTRSGSQLGSERGLQAAAGLHLLAIAAAVLGPSSPPLPIFLTVTGLALVVLALTRTAQPADAHGHAASRDDHDPHLLALERQSQRLVEIADAASRARREAEMRSQLWAELTARMSHELRTPLNAVIGFSDLMSAEIFGPLGHDRYRDYTRHIRECGRSLLKCTEDTLALTSTLAKTPSGSTCRTLTLGDLVRDAIAFHDAEAKVRRIEVGTRVTAGLEIVGDARPVRQVLVNLIAEAIERSRAGSAIVIAAEDDGSVVSLTLTVNGAVPRADVGQASLAVCIARVLLEQQGSGLIDADDHETWQVTTFFERAVQADFFNAAMRAEASLPEA